MTSHVSGAFCAMTLLLVTALLAGCTSGSEPSRRYSAYDCKQMHGRVNITLEERQECRFTGQVQSLKSK